MSAEHSILPYRDSVLTRLARKIRVNEATGCWEWSGYKLAPPSLPYGCVNVRGRIYKVHRVMYALRVGAIPDGQLVCHRCDNPPCCNPGHLFLGSNADNMADKAKKGRAAKGEKSGSRLHPERLVRGESHRSAKLNYDKAEEIKQRVTDGLGVRAAAREYGVHHSTICLIMKGRTWNRLPANKS